MEGSLIRGPFSLGEGSVVKMGAKIYGATTIGPQCVAGGEIKNTVFFGYSNKAHDGYVGDAVIGEWCNLGANTNCSNLKNNVRNVHIWNERIQSFASAGSKCGMLMGDYSRSGINMMINTGTLIGVSCNIYGAGFPPKYLPSFIWGQKNDWAEYRLAAALQDAEAWMRLKKQQQTSQDRKILEHIFNHTNTYRKHLLET
jgi:UDP-N-acetylglucosamine diphosphorylase/glucosamine-1-phosphate N-acetyltransferase